MSDIDGSVDMDGRAGGGSDLPDGYADHLRARRDRAAEETGLLPAEEVLASARSREETGVGSGRSVRRVMMAAAVVVMVLIGAVVVALMQNSTVTVDTAAPGDGPAMPTDQGGVAGPTSGPNDPLDGLPLLFPPGDVDQMQARVGGDPEIPESSFVIDASVETLVSGEVGKEASMVSVVSAPPSGIDDVLDVLFLRRVLGFIGDDVPLDTEYVRQQVLEQFVPQGGTVEVREIAAGSTPHTGPVVEVWIRTSSAFAMDARVVRIPGESSTTIVIGSNVDRAVVDDVVGGLVQEGDLLRVGELPAGFERLGERSVSNSLGWGYSTIAPPELGQTAPTMLQADRLETAGLSITMMTRSIGGPGTSVVLRSGPDWVIGTVNPSIVMGVRDGQWVAVGDFVISDGTDDVDADGRVPVSTIDRLLDLWDGIQAVDRNVFDRAVDRAARSRAGGGNDMFGFQDQPAISDEVTTTTIVGGPGD